MFENLNIRGKEAILLEKLLDKTRGGYTQSRNDFTGMFSFAALQGNYNYPIRKKDEALVELYYSLIKQISDLHIDITLDLLSATRCINFDDNDTCYDADQLEGRMFYSDTAKLFYLYAIKLSLAKIADINYRGDGANQKKVLSKFSRFLEKQNPDITRKRVKLSME